MKTLVTLLLLLLTLGLGAVFFIFSGFYNIAASAPYLPQVEWVFEETMRSSVAYHAREIRVPGNFQDADRLEGFRHYREMCLACHGRPGGEKSSLAKGLNPKPQELVKSADKWSAAEIWWITTHGIKMTGMPAFGESYKKEELWAIVAFVKDLPGMSLADWGNLERTLVSRQEGHDQSNSIGSHEHGPHDEGTYDVHDMKQKNEGP